MTAGLVVAALGVALVVAGLAPATTDAAKDRTFAPTMGIVRAPVFTPLGMAATSAAGYPGRSGAGQGTHSAAVDFTNTRLAVRRAVAYETVTGENVWVTVSKRYREDTTADRRLVSYVESLLHGREIAGLRLMVLRGDEVGGICGPGTAACYLPATGTIVVVGEDRFGGLPTDYVLAHEYGHRIAQYSANPPFRGGAFWHGPKRWATYEGVCSKLGRGTLSIGRTAYWNFPGEIFAEAYARYHIRGQVRWQYAPSLRPDRGSFAAIEHDVRRPWRGSYVRDIRRRLPPGGEHTFRIKTPLDGRLTADLYSLDGGRFQFEMRRRGRVMARASRPTTDYRLSRMVCGQREAVLTVRAGRRGGAYRLIIDRP